MVDLIESKRHELAELCRRYRVRRLDLFGSAARGGFDPARSDLDFLVAFEGLTIKDAADRYLGLLVDLEDLFHRKIDLVSDNAIRNPHFRRAVDETRISLYAA